MALRSDHSMSIWMTCLGNAGKLRMISAPLLEVNLLVVFWVGFLV